MILGRRTAWIAPAGLSALAACGLSLSLAVRHGGASCNHIPPVVGAFAGTGGTVDAPFAGPGDRVSLQCSDDEVCLSEGGADAMLVTLVFKPPRGTTNVVVLAGGATDACDELSTALAACRAQLGGGVVLCVPPPISGLGVLPSRLEFVFPNTDALLPPAGDGRTLTGPVAIGASRRGSPLPCGLATRTCAGVDEVDACVDVLEPNLAGVGHFVALPPPNLYGDLCTDPSPPCTGLQDELRGTIDDRGNLLVPMDWRGVLVRAATFDPFTERSSDSVSVPRRVLTTLTGLPDVPGSSFLRSLSPGGQQLAPIFDPLVAPNGSPDSLTVFGTVDADRSVLRVARQGDPPQQCDAGPRVGLACNTDDECDAGACEQARCVGGSNAGAVCASGSRCDGGRCGVGLFDFSGQLVADVGPVVVPGATFDARVEGPVPLTGLISTESVRAFVVAESLEDESLNDDTDQIDHVVTLTDRRTDERQPIGGMGAAGRAVVRITDPNPFRFPAVAAENDLVAFLQSEPEEGNRDENADGDTFDPILRVVRLGIEGDLLQERVTADAAPLVNGRSLAISDDKVFFRTRERAECSRTARVVSLGPAGEDANGPSQHPALSGDGRSLAFDSIAENLVAGDSNAVCDNTPSLSGNAFVENCSDVFVRPLGHGVADGPIVRVSVRSDGTEGNGPSFRSSISHDGRFVVFESRASNLDASVIDDNELCTRFWESSGTESVNCTDVFLHDRDANETGTFDEPGGIATRLISARSDGRSARGNSFAPVISADGRTIIFVSEANDLPVPGGDGRPAQDLFRFDRVTGDLERVTAGVAGLGAQLFAPALAGGGAGVSFHAGANSLIGTHTLFFGGQGAFVQSTRSDQAELSHDGQLLVFRSFVDRVPGDTNASADLFAFDARTGALSLVNVDPAGIHSSHFFEGGLGLGSPFGLRSGLSADGRFVTFDVVENLLGPGIAIFTHDRLARMTERVAGDLPTIYEPSVSGSGDVVAFAGCPGPCGFDVSRVRIFVNDCDPLDPAGDLSGDGARDDAVLRIFDADAPAGTGLTTTCPADEVVVAAGAAAFLRPEQAGTTANVGCSSPELAGPDSNGDLDDDDRVVHLWRYGRVDNLGCAATSVALSETHVAAAVPGADGVPTVRVLALDQVLGSEGPNACESWSDTGLAAAHVDIVGSLVAFLTPDGADPERRLLKLYDAASGEMLGTASTAIDFVMGPPAICRGEGELGVPCARARDCTGGCGPALVAFRTREAIAGGNLNAAARCPPRRGDALCDPLPPFEPDADLDDDVLQVYDVLTDSVLSSGNAVTACPGESCDPRLPYNPRVHTVEFITLEPEQGNCDLNRNCLLDHAKQFFNVRRGAVEGSPADAVTPIAAVRAGTCDDGTPCLAASECVPRCTAGACDDGTECTTDAHCVPRCIAPIRKCALSRDVPCDDHDQDPCGPAAVCFAGDCHDFQPRLCASDADCNGDERCVDTPQGIAAEIGPFLPDPAGGQLFLSQDGDRLVVVGAPDSDGDEVSDPFDNCPSEANPEQRDSDGDGTGDDCDRERDCSLRPMGGCRVPLDPERASFLVLDRSKDKNDRFSWKWSGGSETHAAAFGDPRVSDDYSVCVYGGASQTRFLALDAPAGRVCTTRRGRRSCWRGLGKVPGTRGFRYSDRAREAPEGLTQLLLRPGKAGRARLVAQGKGPHLPDDLLPLPLPVVVQLQAANGECWEATYTAAGVRTNDAQRFKAKGS